MKPFPCVFCGEPLDAGDLEAWLRHTTSECTYPAPTIVSGFDHGPRGVRFVCNTCRYRGEWHAEADFAEQSLHLKRVHGVAA